MAVIDTRTLTLSDVVKEEYDPSSGITREVVTVNLAGATTLTAGAVLAKVTATGKYILQDASLASGAGLEAAGVFLGKDELTPTLAVAATTDTKVLMLARGPAKVVVGKLTFGAGTDTNAEKQAVYDALAAKGIVTVTAL